MRFPQPDFAETLARDLHDGVIQSIYAAGLGLESALSQMEPDQPGVQAPLQQCRQSLNDVIREVRGFITGLEPEQIHRQGFAQSLEALARTMQALAHRLTASHEVHTLRYAEAKEEHTMLQSSIRAISL